MQASAARGTNDVRWRTSGVMLNRVTFSEGSHTALFNHLLPFLGVEADARRVYTRSKLIQSLSEVVRWVQNLSLLF